MTQLYNGFLLLGGIALFLYGINYMSQSLYEALGDNLRNVLEKLTTTPLHAVLLGAGVTALIQSSGATMVMVTGFVAAQLMTLSRGIDVMLGAAIGTTVTAQIIAFDISRWAPFILFVGVILLNFIKNRDAKKIGAVITGFGLLFMGIYAMSDAIAKMNLGALVQSFLDETSNPVLGFLFGVVFTLIIQSSSASVGILQVLLAATAASDFSLWSVVYIIIGMNVGAVAPPLLASLSGNRAGKRAAAAATFNKLQGAVIFFILLAVWPGCISLIAQSSAASVSRQIANFHLIFNLVTNLILIPFADRTAALMMRIMPDNPEDTFYAHKLLYIGKGQDRQPSIMVAQCRQEIYRFADLVLENYRAGNKAFFDKDLDLADEVKDHELTINYLHNEIYQYMLHLHGRLLPESDLENLGRMFNIMTDLERIGDYADNLADYTIAFARHKADLSDAGWSELKTMREKCERIVENAIIAYKARDLELVKKVQREEDEIDDLTELFENNHIDRMRTQTCDPRGGTILIDMLIDYERVGDHSLNIAETLLGASAPVKM